MKRKMNVFFSLGNHFSSRNQEGKKLTVKFLSVAAVRKEELCLKMGVLILFF